MKKNLTILIGLFISTLSFAQTPIVGNVPWWSGKDFGISGHISTNLDWNNADRKFDFTGGGWYNYSSILTGSGTIKFVTKNNWQNGGPTQLTGTQIEDQVRMTIDYAGRVGIGTDSPIDKLELRDGFMRFDKTGTGSSALGKVGLLFSHNAEQGYAFYTKRYVENEPGVLKLVYKATNFGMQAFTNKLMVFGNIIPENSSSNSLIDSDLDLYFNGKSEFVDRALFDDKVGVGTANIPADYQLAVKGGIITDEVLVTTEGSAEWPDYVFGKDYKLKTLHEVEEFIDENKHLPGIPSAEEVDANGVKLGEMNASLLEKVEELTLYLIEQNKTIKEQNERIEKLETVLTK